MRRKLIRRGRVQNSFAKTSGNQLVYALIIAGRLYEARMNEKTKLVSDEMIIYVRCDNSDE